MGYPRFSAETKLKWKVGAFDLYFNEKVFGVCEMRRLWGGGGPPNRKRKAEDSMLVSYDRQGLGGGQLLRNLKKGLILSILIQLFKMKSHPEGFHSRSRLGNKKP